MNWWHLVALNGLMILATFAQINSLDKGSLLGCFKRSNHDRRESLRYVKNCFDFCATHFYR